VVPVADTDQDFSHVSFTQRKFVMLVTLKIKHVAPIVNQMSRKAWWLRHGFRRLKIRNWRHRVHKSGETWLGRHGATYRATFSIDQGE
jgi:hypothetical protein